MATLLTLTLLSPAALPADPVHPATSQLIAVAAVAPDRWAPFVDCVADRESHSNPNALNSSGHMGMFQFGPGWLGKLQFHVSRRLAELGVPTQKRAEIRDRLEPLPINRWPERFQRIGMIQVLIEGERDHSLKGWRHWYHAGSRCNALAVTS
ncbi:MAG: transglycosylase SLT domain-containing protein [bacterium]|nr:transglycosylase SLT domain-containing protein [bacterium]